MLLAAPGEQPKPGMALAVRNDRVLEVAAERDLLARHPDSRIERMPNCLLMPGLVNAHQHGRGLSQVQLGYADDFLELWIAGRRGRGVLDPYPITKLAAANMLANGVTTTIHANYSYGTGDYEAEVRASLRAYDEAGIRVTMCVGAMDRGFTVYPPHETCFLEGLPAHLREWLSRPGVSLYAGDAKATIALMDRLMADYGSHPRIRLCYGPAGPQWVSDELWKELARDADQRGIGMHLHALESPAQMSAATQLFPEGVFAHLERLGAMNKRTVVAHGVWVSDRDIDVIARADATVVRNAGCNLRLRNGIAPLTRYLARGARVAIGTDNASLADDEDLLRELRLAALLARAPSWQGDAPPSASDLLAMATVNGAVAAQVGDDTGTLRSGQKADLIALGLERTRAPYLDSDMSLVDAMLARASGADIRLTMVDGCVVYSDGLHTRLDRSALFDQVAAAAVAARLPAATQNRDLARQLKAHLSSHYAATTRSG